MDLNWRPDHLAEENGTEFEDGGFVIWQFTLNERGGERNRFSMLGISCLGASRKDNAEAEQVVLCLKQFIL
ncbi:hypothetical protein SUGI_0341860 [Cryptomeria japonica]|nr:hypothetical protein SUGI_0341860 [Cryptomeria japonica]